MRKFSSRMAFGALIATLGLATAGCGQIRMLKAKMAFKDANQLYQQQDYKAASAKYEEAIAADPSLTYCVLLPRQQLRQPVPSGASR